MPDLDEFALKLAINKIDVDGGQLYPVEGINQLTLSEVQLAGMLSIHVILTAFMLACLAYFYYRRASPIEQARSFLFDALFVLGTVFVLFTVLEQTRYSGGYRFTRDGRVHTGTHNPCHMYNVLIGLAIICCYGSLYAMVRRAHLIHKRIRQSTDLSKAARQIKLNGDNPSTTIDTPIPTIPDVQSDLHIIRPVLACIVVELLFQLIWFVAAPLTPTMHVASDGFRSYEVCQGREKARWVYASIALKIVMCLFFVYYISNGRKISDPLGETKRLTWVGWNMTFASIVGVLLVYFLDDQDSIKTSFIVSTFAMFWACVLYFALVQCPRLYQLTTKVRDQFWYDGWIIQTQEDFIAAKAREEKEAKNQNANNSSTGAAGGSSIGHSTAGGGHGANASALGASSLGASSLVSSGSIRNLKQPIGGSTSAAGGAKPTMGVGRVMGVTPSTRRADGTLRRPTTTAAAQPEQGRAASASIAAVQPALAEPTSVEPNPTPVFGSVLDGAL